MSDPRLASHSLFPSGLGCLSSTESTATVASSPLPLLSQASSSSVFPGVSRIQDTQASQLNGNLPQWLYNSSSNFSTSPSGIMVDAASISGTTNSLQTPIISSQLHGSKTGSRITGSPILGRQPSPLNTNPQTGSQPITSPGMLPPPPPNPSQGMPSLNSFVPIAMASYTVMSSTSVPSPVTIPFSPCSFTIPPPRPVVVSPSNSLNIPPCSAVECSPPHSFPLNSSSFSLPNPLVPCSFSSSLPSSSSSATIAPSTIQVSRRPLTNGGNSNSIIDSIKVNGSLRHEPRKYVENYGTTVDSRGDRRSFGEFRGSNDIGRGSLRDPRGRDRDRERSNSRGLQQQLHNNGGRRYSSDNRNRVTRYRDYDGDRRSRYYDPSRVDFNRNRR